MKHVENVDLKDTIARSYFVTLSLLPILLVAALGFTLFVDFLGTQADEIARLVRDLELQCESEIGFPHSGGGFFKCADFLPKIVLFFVLVFSWIAVSSIVTIRLFEFVPAKSLRLPITVFVAASVPALLLIKYLLVVQAVSSFAILYGVEALLLILFVFFYFDSLSEFARRTPVMLLIMIGCVTIFVAMSLTFAFYDPNLFSSLGTLNTIMLYVTLVYAFLGGLFFYSRETGIPWITGLAVWVLIVNFSGWNHREPIEMEKVSADNQVTGDEQFLKWLAARRDAEKYKARDEAYPVYIVAAAGGGTYAAIRTAYMLAYLQKVCPSLAHHTFAISSVSGGGLGALAFVAQQKANDTGDLPPCAPPTEFGKVNDDPINIAPPEPTVLDRFFSKDLLSTLVGSGLFPDMLQRIVPRPIVELDRSIAFRNALGQHWVDALHPQTASPRLAAAAQPGSGCTPESFFNDCEITTYWKPEGDVPILIFNATHVDTGAPIVLSNLSEGFYPPTANVNRREFLTRTIRLIDAASLSARYPVVLPAGFLPEDVTAKRWFRLVDGGYFDTSGLITADAIKSHIEAIATANNLKVKVRMIFLGERNEPSPKAPASPAQMSNAASIQAQLPVLPGANDDTPVGSEIGAHFLALIEAGYQRTNFVVNRFLKTVDNTLAFRWEPEAKSDARRYCQDVPLAWYLAPCTLELTRSRLDDTLIASTKELEALRADLAQ